MFLSISHILTGLWAVVVTHCFNIDTEGPRIIFGRNGTGFGEKVLQFGGGADNWIVTTAPGETGDDNLYHCRANNSCEPIRVSGELGNVSLLTVAASGKKMVVCAPSVPQPCASNIHLTGRCLVLDHKLNVERPVSPGKEGCPVVMLDVVFLFDGSNSLSKRDLQKNKQFMTNMISSSDQKTMNFAIVQYSASPRIELSFWDISDPGINVTAAIGKIALMESVTMTADAIGFVTKEVFTKKVGAREGAKRMLIVITDGARSHGDADLNKTIEASNAKQIVRCAIGVGDVFQSNAEAGAELAAIASSPEFLIKVKSYDDLQNIFEGMKSKIYNIEGTQSASNETSFEQEMSQSGFSAAVTEDAVILGSLGSFDWSGGIFELTEDSTTFLNVSKSHADMKNSYLGYSVAISVHGNRTSYVAGAPRFQHKGKVVSFRRGENGSKWHVAQHIPGEQIGSYFGSELCTVDVDGDGETDILLIGAPLYHRQRTGGVVVVYTVTAEGTYSYSHTLQGQVGNTLGRFGSAIAALSDLDGDRLGDVAVGAPLEDGHGGSVYLYHGTERGIGDTWSQRIAASTISPSLSYFGRSVQGQMDVTGDGLTDLVVGARGSVIVLRSRPVIDVTAGVSHTPEEISLWRFACSGNSQDQNTAISNLTVCFNVSLSTVPNTGMVLANLTYSVNLDMRKLSPRVGIDNLERGITRHQAVTRNSYCFHHGLFILSCVQDYLSPVEVTLNFSLSPLLRKSQEELPPVLNQRSKTTLTQLIPVEKNCGEDNNCTDNLNVTFHLGGMGTLVVGNSSLVEVSVSLWNLGEDSYHTSLGLSLPAGLHFRKLSNLQATQVICSSDANSTAHQPGIFSCNISHPILNADATAEFVVTFEVSELAKWGKEARLTAQANSQNEYRILDDSVHSVTVPVLYGVKIILSKVMCTRYINVLDVEDQDMNVRHVYKVENVGIYDVPVNVTFRVSRDVGGLIHWNVQGPLANPPGHSVVCVNPGDHPSHLGHSPSEWRENVTDSIWSDIFCYIPNLVRNSSIEFTLVGPVHSLKKEVMDDVKLEQNSRAHTRVDTEKFINIYPPRSQFAQAVTEIEIQKHHSHIPLIIGSTASGLILLILIIILFYKCGFFNRNFKEKICAGDDISRKSDMLGEEVPGTPGEPLASAE